MFLITKQTEHGEPATTITIQIVPEFVTFTICAHNVVWWHGYTDHFVMTCMRVYVVSMIK